MRIDPSAGGPHAGQPVLTHGDPLATARVALILLHGRGAGAADMLSLARLLQRPGLISLAPQASDATWYPQRFIAPLAANEPWLGSALAAVGNLLDQLTAANLPAGRTVLLGFSQGACLALEYAARHAQRYGGVVALSGGLIGPDGTPRDYPGSLATTPVFLGCSDVDAHIPLARVEESARIMQSLGGDVTTRIYPGMGHTVNQDELDHVQALLTTLLP